MVRVRGGRAVLSRNTVSWPEIACSITDCASNSPELTPPYDSSFHDQTLNTTNAYCNMLEVMLLLLFTALMYLFREIT